MRGVNLPCEASLPCSDDPALPTCTFLPATHPATPTAKLTQPLPATRRDPVSGRKTGVAYLQYSSAAEAQAALGLDGGWGQRQDGRMARTVCMPRST